MRSLFTLLLAALFFSLLPTEAAAQFPGMFGSPPGPSLDKTLSTAQLPEAGCVFTVAPEGSLLPPDRTVPKPGEGYTDVATAYDMLLYRFGEIYACGPSKMTVPNTELGTPNIYADMDAAEAMEFLISSLEDEQWNLLTSSNGIGWKDLYNGPQRFFFNIVIPSELTVSLSTKNSRSTQLRIPDSDRTAFRIRLGQSIGMWVPAKEDGTQNQEAVAPDIATEEPSVPQRFHARSMPTLNMGKLHGVTFTHEQTNQPKAGDLDLRASDFDALISLKDIRTVGDLIAAVSQRTKVELYASPQYEKRTVRIYGSKASSLPARDLLKSVAFCLQCTYREVGEAYVLTKDLIGLQVRQVIGEQFRQFGISSKSKILTDISFGKRRLLRDLPFFEDPLALSSQQAEMLAHPPASSKEHPSPVRQPDGVWSLRLPYADLTPAQQKHAKRILQAYREQPIHSTIFKGVNLDGKFHLQSNTTVSILAPKVLVGDNPQLPIDGLIIRDDVSPFRFSGAKPSLVPDIEGTRQMLENRIAQPVPNWEDAIKDCQVRAVLLRPRSIQQLDNVIDAMDKLGFNQLWLEYFYDGKLQSTLADPDDSSVEPVNLLDYATAQCKPLHISVTPVFSLLKWGKRDPETSHDLNVIGETTPDYANRIRQIPPQVARPSDLPGNWRGAELLNRLNDYWVSPSSEPVLEALKSALSDTLKHDGISGIVFRDSSPNDLAVRYPLGAYFGDRIFGYTLDARLAFLRKEHIDPIDLVDQPSFETMPDLSAEYFRYQDMNRTLFRKWHASTVIATQDMLNSLAKVALEKKEARAATTIYLRQKESPREFAPLYIVCPPEKGETPAIKIDSPGIISLDAGAKPTLPVVGLPMWYVDNPDYQLASLHDLPDDAAANSFAFRQWRLDNNHIAPLSIRRMTNAIRDYANKKMTSGFVLDLTPESGLEHPTRKFADLAKRVRPDASE